jgi:hypothetical protein
VDLVVKIPLWREAPDLAAALAAGPQASTRAEFEALVEIASMVERSGDPSLAAVRPVAYLDEVNAVVTERLDSRPLGTLRRAERIAAAPALGRWLRRYHDEIGGAHPAPFDPSAVVEALQEAAAGIGPGRLADAAAGLERAAEALRGIRVRIAETHGDLGPSNVLVTPSGRVAVIDPNRVAGAAVHDLAKPSLALRTRRARLLCGIPAGPGDRFEDRLVEGYGGADPRMLALASGLAAVRRWADVEGAARGLRSVVLPPARRVLAAEAARAACAASRPSG